MNFFKDRETLKDLKDMQQGNTALHEVAFHDPENTELFQRLLDDGCTPKQINNSGLSVERLVERRCLKQLGEIICRYNVRRRAFNYVNKLTCQFENDLA